VATPTTDRRPEKSRWRRRRRISLVTKVGVLSAIAVAVLGIALAYTLSDIIRAQALATGRDASSMVAAVGVQPLLTPEDLQNGLDPNGLNAVDGILRASLTDGQVSRIKIWNAQGRLIYSDDLSQIGAQFPASDELNAALAGNRSSSISDLTQSENVDERRFGRLLEVYVPLQFAGQSAPSGAYEIYRPYAPIAATIDHDTRRIYLVLIIGLTVLWVLLFRIMVGASRTMRRQVDKNRHQALHDALTELPNRTFFRDHAHDAMAAARRTGTQVAIIMIDLDRFKEVNDTLGHHVGDRLLTEIGSRLRDVVPPSGTVARLGGDEFAVLLANRPDRAEAAALVLEIADALREPFPVDGLNLEVEASAGIVMFPDDGDDVDLLLQRADVAMYLAKEARTPLEFYDPGRDRYSADRLVLLGDLRRSIADNDLVLHYQPLIDLESGAVQSVEALVRWNHPERGLLGPDQFVPLAEQTGLIWPLTQWVLAEALAQLALWRDRLEVPRVSVNLSARSLTHPDLLTEIRDSLELFDLPAQMLELEITESTVMADPDRAQEVLHGLRGLGIELAIDDFGTGHSSLTYLQRLPVDWLKIDKSFVRDMATDVNDAAIVRTSVELGHSLGLRVVAEGIETRQAQDQLTRVGCDVGQGFHISRPVSAERFEAWLKARTEPKPALR
jgi:diguanylate cyclase (GGDEF)-like protein